MSSDLLPPPNMLGVPEKFGSWRPDQAEALLRALDTEKRYAGLVLPTGAGKSVVAVLMHFLTGKRVAILTSTKGLQEQLMRDFREVGLIDIRGQNAYECLAVRPGGDLYGSIEHPATCDRGPCKAKVRCKLRDDGCLYFDAFRKAQDAELLITNYAYWMTQHRHGQGLGKFDILVCDEAHNVPDELAGFLNTELRRRDIADLLHAQWPDVDPESSMVEQMEVWTAWANQHASRLEKQLERNRPMDDEATGTQGQQMRGRAIGQHLKLNHLLRTLQMIEAMRPEDWLLHNDQDRVVFDPVWVAGYAESALFRDIPKIVLMSATFRPKTAELIGLDPADIEFYEARSGFEVARRPVYVLKGAPRVDFRMSDSGFAQWIGLINNILDQRKDRKGIIHTVSYKRRNQIIQLSRHRDRMMSHDSHNTRAVVEEFKRAPAGTILVSPSMSTGWDFPYSECEFQIVTKMPFPDSRDPVMKARTAEDKDYGAYLMMQELVQATGRGMRAPDDVCETFIVDGHSVWALGKYRDLAPRWFHEAVKKIDVLPPPLPKLEE